MAPGLEEICVELIKKEEMDYKMFHRRWNFIKAETGCITSICKQDNSFEYANYIIKDLLETKHKHEKEKEHCHEKKWERNRAIHIIFMNLTLSSSLFPDIPLVQVWSSFHFNIFLALRFHKYN